MKHFTSSLLIATVTAITPVSALSNDVVCHGKGLLEGITKPIRNKVCYEITGDIAKNRETGRPIQITSLQKTYENVSIDSIKKNYEDILNKSNSEYKALLKQVYEKGLTNKLVEPNITKFDDIIKIFLDDFDGRAELSEQTIHYPFLAFLVGVYSRR